MSLKPQSILPTPDETVRIARAAFPKGNVYLKMRDELLSNQFKNVQSISKLRAK